MEAMQFLRPPRHRTPLLAIEVALSSLEERAPRNIDDAALEDHSTSVRVFCWRLDEAVQGGAADSWTSKTIASLRRRATNLRAAFRPLSQTAAAQAVAEIETEYDDVFSILDRLDAGLDESQFMAS